MTSWLRQYCIYVSDLDAAIAFWETLGLECTSRTVITDDITEAVLENPEKGGWIQLAHNKQHTGPIDMGTAMWKLYLYTDDCHTRVYHSRAVAAGYESVTPPATPDHWPVTMAFVSDPDGYLVELLERHEPATERNAGGTTRDKAL